MSDRIIAKAGDTVKVTLPDGHEFEGPLRYHWMAGDCGYKRVKVGDADVSFPSSWLSVVKPPYRPTKFGEMFTARLADIEGWVLSPLKYVYLGEVWAGFQTSDGTYSVARLDHLTDFEPVTATEPTVEEVLAEFEQIRDFYFDHERDTEATGIDDAIDTVRERFASKGEQNG